MKAANTQWLMTGLVAVVAVLATVLVMKSFQSGPFVYAQESAGSASGVVGVLGPENSNRLPLFLVDTQKARLLVYEYDVDRRELFLRVVRSYKQDRELEDESFDRMGPSKGPSVEDVKDIVRDNLD